MNNDGFIVYICLKVSCPFCWCDVALFSLKKTSKSQTFSAAGKMCSVFVPFPCTLLSKISVRSCFIEQTSSDQGPSANQIAKTATTKTTINPPNIATVKIIPTQKLNKCLFSLEKEAPEKDPDMNSLRLHVHGCSMATDTYGLQGRKMEAPRLAKCM